jgi:hypothetical protein
MAVELLLKELLDHRRARWRCIPAWKAGLVPDMSERWAGPAPAHRSCRGVYCSMQQSVEAQGSVATVPP